MFSQHSISAKRWTQIFYAHGNNQEVLNSLSNEMISPDQTPDAEAAEPIHVRMHRQQSVADTGFFSWIIATWRLRNDQILRHAGPDACNLFNFSFMHSVMELLTFRPLPFVPTSFDCCSGNHHADFHRYNPTNKFYGHSFWRRQFLFTHNNRQFGPELSIDMDSHYLCDPLCSPCRAHHETIQW